MNRRVEAKQVRAQETRRAISGAYRTLAEQSRYDEISIAQIALAAGVGKGTVLAHFSEKLAIAATIFAKELERIAKRLKQEGTSDISTICAQLASILEWAAKDDVYARLSVGDGAQICREVIAPSEDRLVEQLTACFGASNAALADDRAQAVRANLVYAIVVLRVCADIEEAKSVFFRLCARV
ncbi:TetR/AcrR family transcriptional regulator [uncultured Maritalea sp.]|jgi:AcrR family transcriptional regulator|uniref:TetR/AcrR family transcriptional regulator n=1 Tax=uncultured Maritalea sp. TaxID=757249 RepID=UPI0026293A5E|nr:TetR/AcrR family transcriptional regulator [uncultured Maritalea sp.]